MQGSYRVQSRRDYAPSSLEGEWYISSGLISNDVINNALRAHASWQGREQVRLSPALVYQRRGKFSFEPDILYKNELFIPKPGTPAMDMNIVDVLKSRNNWIGRVDYIKELFPEISLLALQKLHGLELVIANEYMLHEAGHFLAYDVCAKQREGYFSVMGKTAWPLVYLEELRADLNAFGFAAQLLAPEKAAQIFLYNVMLRFGVHREGIVQKQQAPYGLVPYLLFHLLQDLGFLSVCQQHGRRSFNLTSLETNQLTAVMCACARHAEQELNAPELTKTTALEKAIVAAKYVRNRLDDTAMTELYDLVMNQPAISAGRRDTLTDS